MTKSSDNEEIASVIMRNTNFANLCGILYECTTFFSALSSANAIFYFKLNCPMLFEQFYCNLNIPTCTTVDQKVANNYISKKTNGILLSLKSATSDGSVYTFDVEWLSSYKHKRERVFFESTLMIQNIAYWKNNTLQTCEKQIEVLLLYDAIIHGAFTSSSNIISVNNDTDKLLIKALKQLMRHQAVFKEDLYISSLFDNYRHKNILSWINFAELNDINVKNNHLVKLFIDEKHNIFGEWVSFLIRDTNTKIVPLYLFECNFSSYKMQQIFSRNNNQCVVNGNYLCCEFNTRNINVVFQPYVQSWDTNKKLVYGIKLLCVTPPITNVKISYNVNITSINYYEHFSPIFMSTNNECGALNRYEGTHLNFNDNQIDEMKNKGFCIKIAIMIHEINNNLENISIRQTKEQEQIPSNLVITEDGSIPNSWIKGLSFFYGLSNSVFFLIDQISDYYILYFWTFYFEFNLLNIENNPLFVIWILSVIDLISVQILYSYRFCKHTLHHETECVWMYWFGIILIFILS
eukprot:160222_1